MTETLMKGPRPLSLHISNSQITWTKLQAMDLKALQAFGWHEDMRPKLAAFWKAMQTSGCSEEAFLERLREKAADRQDQFLKGVNKYLSTPYKPVGMRGTVVQTCGGVHLHDYGGEGVPIMLVPSLINPSYIVDLMPGRSLVDFLRTRGFRPYVLNWGTPGDSEKSFDVDAYVMQRLVPMLTFLYHHHGGPVPVIGYCMGGTLTVALASFMGEMVSKLVLMAAPWDFDTEAPHPGRRYAAIALEKLSRLPSGTTLAVDMLQSFFTSVDPTLSDRKFRSYAQGKYDLSGADFFAAMEIWANNSPPLAAPVARDCLTHWYQGNATVKGTWMVNGAAVKPEKIKCPVLVAAPAADRLVPQESAFAIRRQIPHSDFLEPPSGHIGMVVGDRAPEGLWHPLEAWLKE